MTDETVWVRAGRNYGANAPMLHTDEHCRMMDKSERDYREATANERQAYETCSVCSGDYEQAPPTREHLESLKAAAEADDD